MLFLATLALLACAPVSGPRFEVSLGAGVTPQWTSGRMLLGTDVGNCYADSGRVIDKASGRSVGYGDILQKVKIDRKFAYPDDLKSITLKDPSSYKIIGKSMPALDIPAKTNGQAKYGIDVFLPNMAYGALVIPRGTKVMVHMQALHKDPRHWPEPEAFRPDRFLGDEPVGHRWLPFITGPRSCVGQHFSLLEAKIVLSRLALRYDFTPAPENSDARHRYNIPVGPRASICMHVRPRG